MPVTLGMTILDVRSRLDEVSPRFYDDFELIRWINQAMNDIARRTETIKQYNTSIMTQAGQAKYPMPTDMIRIHRVEFVPVGNSTNVYPVQASNHQEMDQYWGITPTIQQSYPSWYVLWGFPPNVTMQLYPVPSTGANLNIYYYRLPLPVSSATDLLEIPEGWQDAVGLYVEYIAKRKARDPLWADAKKLYEETVQLMLDVTRELHDQSQSIFLGQASIPAWLYGTGDY